MNYNIEIKNIESVTAAVMKYKGPVTEAANYFPNVFKSIMGKSNGAPFFCYYGVDSEANIGEMELCVPTAEIPKSNGITIKNFESTKAICVTYVGPYDKLPNVYEEVCRYIQQNGLDIQPPWREVFIKGPGVIMKGNPNKYITEIMFPLKEGE